MRDCAEVRIFTAAFVNPSALRGFDEFVAEPGQDRICTRAELPDLRIIAQTRNPAYHIDLAATEELKILLESYCATLSVEVIDNGGDAQKVI